MASQESLRGTAGWFARRLAMPGTGRPSPRSAVRMAISLAVPLAVGLAIGQAQLGMIAALTAFFTALAEPAGSYRAHATTYIWLGVGQALMALLGALTAGTVVWAGLAGLGVGLATGAIVASGTRLSVAGPFPLLLFVVIQGVYPTPGVWQTVVAALLGSAWVVVATLLPIVVAPFLPVEVTVAEAWRAVAMLAADPSSERLQLMTATATEQARADIIAAPGTRARWRRRRDALWAAVEEAQRNMTALIAMGPATPATRPVLQAAARVANDMAGAATHAGRRVDTTALDRAVAAMHGTVPDGLMRTANRLATRMRAAADAIDGHPPAALVPIPQPDRLATWRPIIESMRWGAPGLRHGLRLGIAAGGCMAVFGMLGEQLPFVTHHAPWVTITLVDVLAPSLGASVQRITQRALGTAVGAIAAALVIWGVGDPWILALIATVAGATAALIRSVNYAWFMALFTPLVLLIVSSASPLGPGAAVGRMTATLVGCGVGFLIAVAIWPSRSRTDVVHSIAQALRAIADDVALGITVAQEGRSPTEMSEVNRTAINRTHHAMQLLDGTAIESMARRNRYDPLADLASATMALVDEAATLGTRLPEKAVVIPGTIDATRHMERVLRATADDVDAHAAPPDPGDMTRELDGARQRVAEHPDAMAGSVIDALDGMLRATRAVTRTAAALATSGTTA